MRHPKVDVGTVLGGRFEIQGLVGGGGQAFVYRARDLQHDRLAAVKVLNARTANTSEFQERFARESKVAEHAFHQNIMPIWASGEDQGVFFIASPLADIDLGAFVEQEGPLEPDRALDIIGQVAWALDSAHQRGVIHRDVKPENILLMVGQGSRDHAYLGDFGIAKSNLGATLTSSDLPMSPAYASPEQIRGQRDLDGRSDQYSLACALYDCLTGKPPFQATTEREIVSLHLVERPQPLTSRAPSLPPAADEVMARALSKVPGDRYGSCQEFVGAMRAALGGKAAQAPPPSVAPAPATVVAPAAAAIAASAVPGWSAESALTAASGTPPPDRGAGTPGPGDAAGAPTQVSQPVPVGNRTTIDPQGQYPGGGQGAPPPGGPPPGGGFGAPPPGGFEGGGGGFPPPGGGGFQGGGFQGGGGPGGPDGGGSGGGSNQRGPVIAIVAVALLLLVGIGIGAVLLLGGDDDPGTSASSTTDTGSGTGSEKPGGTETTDTGSSTQPTETTEPTSGSAVVDEDNNVDLRSSNGFSEQAMVELFARVPYTRNCAEPTFGDSGIGDVPDGATAAIICTLRMGEQSNLNAFYFQFEDAEGMNAAFDTLRDFGEFKTNTGDLDAAACPQQDGEDAFRWTLDDEEQGDVICRRFENLNYIVWDAEAIDVTSMIVDGRGRGLTSGYREWAENAGPIIPDDAG